MKQTTECEGESERGGGGLMLSVQSGYGPDGPAATAAVNQHVGRAGR